ncbi:hypothetical protein MLD38_033807 [Melastoma candidum]|uniref:Uncharacterized protein n=1 Tax=Melastoma candidum TaxID=119954 RepID=A0ACB9MBR2_9MYRT|nr:hypothetical protein MLD38_033807 [Melastoma candidum]
MLIPPGVVLDHEFLTCPLRDPAELDDGKMSEIDREREGQLEIIGMGDLGKILSPGEEKRPQTKSSQAAHSYNFRQPSIPFPQHLATSDLLGSCLATTLPLMKCAKQTNTPL